MEFHYTILTIAFVVLVLILGFIAISMVLPLYIGAHESGLFNNTLTVRHENGLTCSSTTSSTLAHISTSMTTSVSFTSLLQGELRARTYRIYDKNGTIWIDLTLENTYPIEIVVDKIYLNDTLVYKGPITIEPWSQVTHIANDPKTAAMLVTIYGINTGIKMSKTPPTVVSGEMIPVGNITIFYRIPGVQGIHNTVFVLKLPKCMIKYCPIFP